MKILKKIILNINRWNKFNKFVLYWYLSSFVFICLEMVINSHLDKDVYFHPYISFLFRGLLLIDLILFPIILANRSILKDDDKPLMKIFLIVVSNIGIIFIGLVLVFSISFFDRAIFGINTKNMIYEENKIYVQEIWTYNQNNIKVYKKERFFFVRLLK